MTPRKETFAEDIELWLGDCREVLPSLSGRSDHIITDPPYEARMQHLHENQKLRRKDSGPQRKALTFDAMQTDLRDDLLKQVASLNKGWLLIFCNVEGVGEWQSAILRHALKFKNTCIWNKPDSTPKMNGQGPALSYECITTTWCGTGQSRWNGGGRRGVFTFPTNNREREGTHPTEKPVALMRELVGLFSNKNETICDPFMGSGSTGVACAQLQRRFIGIEIEQEYFDIACRRIDQQLRAPNIRRLIPDAKKKHQGFLRKG